MKNLSLISLLTLGLLFISSTSFSQNNFLDFDGNDRVEVPDNPALNPNHITVACWARSNNSSWNSTGMLVSKRNSYIIHPDNGTNNVTFYVDAGGGWVSITQTGIPVQNWNHYALTYDGSTLRGYVNGVALPYIWSYAGSINSSSDNVNIGFDNCCGGTRYLNGQIDEVQIWDKALTPAEITTIMDTERTGLETGLVAYYNFNQGTCAGNNAGETQLLDLAPAGGLNHGNLIGFDLTGSSGSPVGCGSNWVCGGPACAIPSNGVLPIPGPPVPTLGQWGLILLALLLLSFSTVAIMQRQSVLASNSNRNQSINLRQLPFDRVLFMKLLGGVLLSVFAIFAFATALFGYELTNADIPGTLICAPVLAYLLHLLGFGQKE